jgi:hypothetical protein
MAFTAVFIQCSDKNKNADDLQGHWKLDSVYNFYNGFGHTSLDVADFPHHHYLEDGQLQMTKNEEVRDFLYEIHPPDTLLFRTQNGKPLEKTVILSIDQTQLVLKKELSPVFQEKNQHRYEVRYFSRVKE